MAARCQPYVAPHLPPPREGDVAATISVPHRRVGLIIGRGGENVRFLQQQTRAHVQVQPERDVHPAQTERLVYLRGGRDACAEAARMIQDLVDGRARVGTAGLAPPQPPGMIVSHGAAIRGEHATARRRTGWNGVFGGGAYAGGGFAGGGFTGGGFAAWDASAGLASAGLASAGLASAPAPAPAPSPAAAAAVAAVERERQDRHNQMYLAAAASSGGAYVPSPAAVAPAYAAAVAAAAANPWAAHADPYAGYRALEPAAAAQYWNRYFEYFNGANVADQELAADGYANDGVAYGAYSHNGGAYSHDGGAYQNNGATPPNAHASFDPSAHIAAAQHATVATHATEIPGPETPKGSPARPVGGDEESGSGPGSGPGKAHARSPASVSPGTPSRAANAAAA